MDWSAANLDNGKEKVPVAKRTRQVKSPGHKSLKSISSDSGLLDVEADSLVTVTTAEGTIWHGRVVESPKRSLTSGYITLDNLVSGDGRKLIGQKSFFRNGIKAVTIASENPLLDSGKFVFFPREIVMETVLITRINEVDTLISSLSTVDEIGCSIAGAGGRFDKAEYVLFNIRDVIIVISLEKFDGEVGKELWKKLDKEIFSNERITKVFLDSCRAGDYLYHQYSIKLVNVFDLKVTYHFLKERQASICCGCQDRRSEKFASKPVREISQTDLWNHFLPKKVSFMDFFIVLLQLNGSENLKVKRKRLVLQVKYLLDLKRAMQSELLRPLQLATDYHNQIVVQASDEEVQRILSDVDE